MKRFLIVLLLVVLVSVGLAFYLEWISFKSESAGDNFSVSFHVHRAKFHEDTQKAMTKVGIGAPAAEQR